MNAMVFLKHALPTGLCFFLAGTFCTGQGVSPVKQVPEYIKKTKAFKRAGWFYNQRAWPYDTVPRAYARGVMDREISKAKADRSDNVAYPSWTSRGPAGTLSSNYFWGVVSGRVRAIAVHPTDPNTVYIGAACGGIWKTTDGGTTWQDIGAGLETMAFGAIAIDPANPNVVYAGSGECDLLENFNTYSGNGLYKSTDGGMSWTRITSGFGNVTHFSDLVVNPFNSNMLLASLGGGTVYTGVNLPNEGIWRSLDAGITWTRTADFKDVSDLAFHPSDMTKVYAAAGGYMVPMTGFLVSGDQGGTWTQSNSGISIPAFGGRMQFDIARSSPNIIYAVIYELNINPPEGTSKAYKSTDGGTSWLQISAGTILGGFGGGWYDQGWYDLCIAVDPANPDYVLIGNVEIHRTTNGSTFTPVRPYVGTYGNNLWAGLAHCDYHKLVFAPSSPNVLYIGNDGGVYRSTDKGYSAAPKNQGLATLQFYRIASHPSNPQIMMGGMQDNSTAKTSDGGTTWWEVTGGDGMECLFHPNPDTLYTSSQNGQLYASVDSGNTFLTWAFIGGAWVTPFLMHPVDHNVLYSASRKILKSVNGGKTFQTQSYGGNVTPSMICTMAQSQLNPGYMIFGTGMDYPPWDSVFYVKISTDEGRNWTDVSSNIPGEPRWIARVVTDPVDDSTMYVVRTGFSPGNKVWKTTDLGLTWTNISGNLPDLPCNDLFVDPENTQHLFLANDIGVYISTDGGASWYYGGYGMPFVPAIDFSYLKIGSQRYLRVGTHGRSIWETNPDVGVGMPGEKNNGGPAVCCRVNAYPNPSSFSTTITYELPESRPVRIDVYNHLGSRVSTLFEGVQNAGLQKLNFDVSNLRAGIYYCRIRAGNQAESRKIVVIR